MASIKNAPIEFTCKDCDLKFSQPFSKVAKSSPTSCPKCGGALVFDLSVLKDRLKKEEEKAKKLVADIKKLAGKL